MLYGFIEGLVGIEDNYKQFRNVTLSPRWHAAGVAEAEVNVGYEVSDCGFGYLYTESANGIKLNLDSLKSTANVHLLLPENAPVKSVRSSDGTEIRFSRSTYRQSAYVDFELSFEDGADIEVQFK